MKTQEMLLIFWQKIPTLKRLILKVLEEKVKGGKLRWQASKIISS
jgi:hypothetical protein